MSSLQSKGVIRRIIEDKVTGEFLVSFLDHDGYFHADEESLRQALREMKEKHQEISFIYNKKLKIISL